MYIAPNTTVKILKNVPLDITYDHTIYFSQGLTGLTAQYLYFSTKAKYTLSAQSYQRVKRGWLRVDIVADNLYDCNYLMFQNTSFGSKWFYAFIKSVEYINNAVSEIEFEIDVMQTWNSEYTLDQCFVEREHSAEGDTVPLFTDESLTPGTLVYGDDFPVLDMNEMNLVILSTPNSTSTGHIYFNTYNRVAVTSVFPVTPGNIQAIDNYIDSLTQANEQIIAIYQYPRAFASGIEGRTETITKAINKPTYVGYPHYTPRNKKLLYYPYSFLRVSGQNGKYQDYAYEFFDPQIPITFQVQCITIPQTVVVVYPLDYKNVHDCFEEKMIISDFPVCAWATNAFEQWWANNKWSIFADGMCKALELGVSSVLPVNKQIESSVKGTEWGMSTTADIVHAITLPNNVNGNLSTSNVNAGLGKQVINFYNMSVERERAMILDDYFDRFGYATYRNKVPNRDVRPHWCYTKTANCSITGSLPADDMRKICEIYNHGITFWKNGTEVCDYSLDNRITEG